VKALGRLGAAAIAAIAVALVALGVRSQTGQEILSPLGQSARATGRALSGAVSGVDISVPMRLLAAVVIGLALFAVVLMVAPAARTSRGIALAGIGSALAGLVAYQIGVSV
jgi:hypothetical protein